MQAARTWTFTENPVSDLNKLISELAPSGTWLLCDRNTRKYCLPLIRDALPENVHIITVPAGEKSKSLETAADLLKKIGRGGADRHSLLICLGGGMICDLGGFIATLFKRGMRFIFLPTSLLCMADACLGGKNGIDFDGFKNQLGTFSHPEEILLCPGFLKSLPESDLLSGLAEIVKHVLCSNPGMWNELRKSEASQQNWTSLIGGSLVFKQSIVDDDPFEKGKRKILNAGHTIGHALESFFLESGKAQPHGYCVAAGLIIEGRMAVDKGFLTEAELLQAEEFIYTVYGQLPYGLKDIPRIVRFCRQDKKSRKGKILAALFGPIGNCRIDVEISPKEIQSALRYYLGK